MRRTTLSLAASPTLAAGTAVFRMIPRAASIPSGGTMIMDLYIDYSRVTGGLAIARWKFDVYGSWNGTLAGDVNDASFPNEVNNGLPSGPGLYGFAGGQKPWPGLSSETWIGTIMYTDSGVARVNYSLAPLVSGYVPGAGAMNIYDPPAGSMSRPSETISTGAYHLVEFDIRPFQVIVPTPAAAMPLGLMLLAAHRRR